MRKWDGEATLKVEAQIRKLGEKTAAEEGVIQEGCQSSCS